MKMSGITLIQSDGSLLSLDVSDVLIERLTQRLGVEPSAYDIEKFFIDAIARVKDSFDNEHRPGIVSPVESS